MHYRGNKRDDNEGDLIELWRGVGAWVLQMDRTAGFDCLVVFRERVHVAEVKNPDLPPSKRQLTDHEKKVREELESRGIFYNVIETPRQAMAMLGLPYWEQENFLSGKLKLALDNNPS